MKLRFLSIFLCFYLGLSAQVTSEKDSKGNILFIMSNAKTYGDSDIETGTSFAEIVYAYDVFVRHNYKVDFMTPNGGSIHLGHYYKAKDPLQNRYYNDSAFMTRLNTTLEPSEVNPKNYVAVYYVGGGAAMFGVPENEDIQNISRTIYENKGVISAVCHGIAGIVNLQLSNGKTLYKGKQVNGFPDAFEDKTATYYKTFPFSIEEAIKKNGGEFMYSKKGWDNHYVVDGRLVTGQDPSASGTVAEKVVELLEGQDIQFIGAKEDIDLKSEVDNYVNKIMEEFDVKGVAIAILKGDEVVHKGYYGKANIAYNVPVSNTSIFKTHSLTKLFVTVAIFQLIQDNKITLEDSAGRVLTDLPQNWKSIKIKHLLSHSSGLPTMPVSRNLTELEAKEIIFNKDIKSLPGIEYHYNRTNLWLLKRIIENVSQQKFQDFIIENQFNGDDTGISFSADILDIVPNRVTEYYPNEKYEPKIFDFYLPDYLLAAGGLNITLDAYTKWNQQLDASDFLNQKYKAIMTTPFPYRNGSSFFSYGWRIDHLNTIKTIGFSGGGISVFKKIPSKNMTIVLLTNGYRYDPYIERVSNNLLGIVDKTLTNKEGFISEKLEIAINKKEYKNVQTLLNRLKNDKDYSSINFEMIVNDIGYSFLNAIHPRTIEAIEVFKLNTQNYTKSWNCFDSLAEAYKINGDTKNAITNYERAIKRVPKGDKVNINRIKSYIKELKKTKKLTSRIKRSNSKTI